MTGLVRVVYRLLVTVVLQILPTTYPSVTWKHAESRRTYATIYVGMCVTYSETSGYACDLDLQRWHLRSRPVSATQMPRSYARSTHTFFPHRSCHLCTSPSPLTLFAFCYWRGSLASMTIASLRLKTYAPCRHIYASALYVCPSLGHAKRGHANLKNSKGHISSARDFCSNFVPLALIPSWLATNIGGNMGVRFAILFRI